MNQIKKLGLVGLLAGTLSVGSLTLLQEGYAEHKGKLSKKISDEGYSIELVDKTMPNGFKALFLYRAEIKRASLAVQVKDEITGIIISYIMENGNISSGLAVGSTNPDFVANSNNKFRKTRPTEQEIKIWRSYLDALHQQDTQSEWLDKYYIRRRK